MPKAGKYSFIFRRHSPGQIEVSQRREVFECFGESRSCGIQTPRGIEKTQTVSMNRLRIRLVRFAEIFETV